MEEVERWWNGNFGRLARKDVYLRTGSLWEVETREGGVEGRSKVWRFDSEAEARGFLQRCMVSPADWRPIEVPPQRQS